MSRARTAVIAVAAIMLLMLVPLMFQRCGQRGTRDGKILEGTQHTLDSLAATAAAARARADSLLNLVGRDTVRVTQIRRRVDTLLVTVTKVEHAADSLAQSGNFEGAFHAERAANDSLHVAVDSLSHAVTAGQEALRRLAQVYAFDTLRRATLERVNGELIDAVARLEKPCRVVGPIPCPSRTVTFVLSLGLGAAGAVALTTR